MPSKEDGNRLIYDLMNPEVYYADKAIVERICSKESAIFDIKKPSISPSKFCHFTM
jgi:hypothetical protein